jgi:hypothetical protein
MGTGVMTVVGAIGLHETGVALAGWLLAARHEVHDTPPVADGRADWATAALARHTWRGAALRQRPAGTADALTIMVGADATFERVEPVRRQLGSESYPGRRQRTGHVHASTDTSRPGLHRRDESDKYDFYPDWP